MAVILLQGINMRANLNDLRPAITYRVASSMFAVFFIASMCGMTYGIRYWLYQFGKTGLPVAMDAFNILGAFAGAAVGLSVAARFFIYARKLHLQRKAGV